MNRDLYLHGNDIAIRAKSAAGPARFMVTAYTGAMLRLRNFEAPVVVDLARLRYGKSLVANLDHDSTKRVGIVTEVDNDGRRLLLSGTLSAVTAHRDEVLASHRDGFRWQASIEAFVEEYDVLKSGQRRLVNNRTVEGPAFITVSTLKGFAFVSHGADDDTYVSIAASGQRHRQREPQLVSSDFGNAMAGFIGQCFNR